MGNPEGESEDAKPPPQEEDENESSEEEDDEQEVQAAVLGRSKRATAGRRFTDLVGKAAEDDQAFWGHDTWAEEGSDNDSFRESDEDPEHRVDIFDSDFDDSENDNDDEEVADGEKEDAELAQEERKKQRLRSNKYDVAKAARELGRAGGASGKGQHWSGPARILGDGDNAGIVLNLPPASESGKLYQTPGVAISPFEPNFAPFVQQLSSIPGETTVGIPHEVPETADPWALPPDEKPGPPSGEKPVSRSSHNQLPSIVSELSASTSQQRPPRRATEHSKYSSRFRVARNLPIGEHNKNIAGSSKGTLDSGSATSNAVQTSSAGAASREVHHSHKRKLTAVEHSGDRPKRRRTDMTQDQLLMEAVHTTAPENHRWLLGRKRAADEMDYIEKLATAAGKGGAGGGDKKLVQRYSSRRGTLNVVSFYEMDFVPKIFTNQQLQEKDRIKPSVCVVTGKPAHYRDPKSWLPYHDKDAFVELRKRLEDGTLRPLNKQLDSKKKRAAPSSRTAAPSTAASNNTAMDSKSPDPVSSYEVQNSNGTTQAPTTHATTVDGAGRKAAPASGKVKAKAAGKRAIKKKADNDSGTKPKAVTKSRSKKATTKDPAPQSTSAPLGESSVAISTTNVWSIHPAVAPSSSRPPVQSTVNGSIQSAELMGQPLSSNESNAITGAPTKSETIRPGEKTVKGSVALSAAASSPVQAGAPAVSSIKSTVGTGKAPTPAVQVAIGAISSIEPAVATASVQSSQAGGPLSTNSSVAAGNRAPTNAVSGDAQPSIANSTTAVTPTKVEPARLSSPKAPAQKDLFRPSTPVTPTKLPSSCHQSTPPPLSSTSSTNKQKQKLLSAKTPSPATPKFSSPSNNSKNTQNRTPISVQIPSSTNPVNGDPSVERTHSKLQINQLPQVGLVPATKNTTTTGVPSTRAENELPAGSSNSSKG